MFSFLTIWLPIDVALVGVALLLTGWRGRQIDQHPLCPRCGFDLFGKPRLTNIVCPECGLRIRSIRNVRIGHREARRGLIYLSLALILPSLLMLSIAGTMAARGIEWIRFEPVSWLINDGEVTRSSTNQHPAIDELSRRISNGELSTQQLNDVLDHALAVQGDISGMKDLQNLRPPPNEYQWCTLIENARARGKVSDDRWQRYAEQSVVFFFECRPHVRRGDVIPFWLLQWRPRAAQSKFAPTYTLALEIDGQAAPVRPWNYADRPPGVYDDDSLGWSIQPSDSVYDKLGDGEHVAKLIIDVHMPGKRASNAFLTTPISKREILQTRFVLQPADQPSVTTVSDPALKPQIEQWLREPLMKWWNDEQIEIRFDPDPERKKTHNEPPIDLAFRVTIRADGKDWPCLRPICFRGQNSTGWALANAKDFRSKTADIVLQSDPATAAQTLSINRIWDGEIVLKDMPIKPR